MNYDIKLSLTTLNNFNISLSDLLQCILSNASYILQFFSTQKSLSHYIPTNLSNTIIFKTDQITKQYKYNALLKHTCTLKDIQTIYQYKQLTLLQLSET